MGRTFRPTFTKLDQNGQRVKQTSQSWGYEFTSASGRTVRRSGFSTQAQAKDALRKAETEALAEKHGLPSQRAGEVRLADLCESYLADLTRRATPEHVECRRQQIRYMVQKIRVAFVRDLKPEAVELALDELQSQGKSIRTCNVYLQSLKGAFAWAVRRRLLPWNSIESVVNRTGPKVKRRRALTVPEGEALLKAGLDGPRKRLLQKLSGGQDGKTPRLTLQQEAAAARAGRRNALAYRIMLTTGLRLNEVRALTWADCDLEGRRLTLRRDKGDKLRGLDLEKAIPLATETIEHMQAWKAEMKAGDSDKVLPNLPEKFVRTFDDDLISAGIQKTDPAGRTLDVHALRGTCGTWMNAAGADPKSIQVVLRHRHIGTTFGLYVRADQTKVQEAVEALPSLTPRALPSAQEAVLQATGTDDEPIAEPPTNRQAETSNSDKAFVGQALACIGPRPYKQGVTGSSPVSPTIANPEKYAENPTKIGSNANSEHTRTRKPNCTPMHENDPECDGFRQQTAKGNDPDLENIIENWERLPAAVKAAVLLLIESAGGGR